MLDAQDPETKQEGDGDADQSGERRRRSRSGGSMIVVVPQRFMIKSRQLLLLYMKQQH